jgi:hypothetical protein
VAFSTHGRLGVRACSPFCQTLGAGPAGTTHPSAPSPPTASYHVSLDDVHVATWLVAGVTAWRYVHIQHSTSNSTGSNSAICMSPVVPECVATSAKMVMYVFQLPSDSVLLHLLSTLIAGPCQSSCVVVLCSIHIRVEKPPQHVPYRFDNKSLSPVFPTFVHSFTNTSLISI